MSSRPKAAARQRENARQSMMSAKLGVKRLEREAERLINTP